LTQTVEDVAPATSYETPQSRQRRDFVKQMMKTAWDGYRNHAWGENELMPTTRKGHSAGIFGK
jgi:mannosyl-oligosaccharide alpha-1,2-mannosidase